MRGMCLHTLYYFNKNTLMFHRWRLYLDWITPTKREWRERRHTVHWHIVYYIPTTYTRYVPRDIPTLSIILLDSNASRLLIKSADRYSVLCVCEWCYVVTLNLLVVKVVIAPTHQNHLLGDSLGQIEGRRHLLKQWVKCKDNALYAVGWIMLVFLFFFIVGLCTGLW